MNTRKNQNSILVLATLGVYLGLVLAGATPQVLAQAAMTKHFDVKDEIEVKDDLDKKPDGKECDKPYTALEKAGVEFLATYFRGIDRSVKSYGDSQSKGYEISTNITSAGILSDFDNPFTKVNKNITAGFLDQRIDENGLYFQLLLKGNPNEYLESSLYSAVGLGLEVFKCRHTASNANLLATNTSTSSVNDQVFIVTRLPRAGLDSLLAANAK